MRKIWDIKTSDGTALEVETRDRIDWVNDDTDAVMVTGAFAMFTYRTMFEHPGLPTREISVPLDFEETYDGCHRQALGELMEANGVFPFEAEIRTPLPQKT